MLKRNIFVVFIIITVFLLHDQCTPDNINSDELRTIVEKQNIMLENCFLEGNADKLASLYTDSAKLSPNGGDFVIGRNKIREFWSDDFKTSKLLEMTTNVITINGNRNLIYETGKTKIKILYEDSVYESTVKYINIWVKQKDGSYKLDIDFWNKDKKNS